MISRYLIATAPIRVAPVLLWCCISSAFAADQGKINQIIEVTERTCLSGSGYQLSADVNGNILLQSADNVQTNININTKNQKGAVGYVNEEVRKVVDEKIRECMERYIEQIIAIILQQPMPGGTQNFDWISHGQTIAQAQITLKNRPTTWTQAPDGRQVVTYGSLLNGTNMKTSVFFDFNGRAYFARSTTSSMWSSYTSSSGYASPSRQGINPAELCGDISRKMLSYIQDILGPAKQPPNSKKERVNPAWNITRSQAGFCKYSFANCSSQADISTTKAVFGEAGKEVSAIFKFTDAWSNVYNGSNTSAYTRINSCELNIEGFL